MDIKDKKEESSAQAAEKSTHYQFFQNKECENFPCHNGVDVKDFNCIFCFCPLYMLGKSCGGNFYYTQKNIKSCKNCSFPHKRENYAKILSRFSEICEKVKESDQKEDRNLAVESF